jgi:integrase
MSAYLLKRDGGTYYFRRSIPLAQRQRFGGKREWVRSLGTKDRNEAKRLIPACLIAFDKAMDGDASKASVESHQKPFQPPVALAEAMEPYNTLQRPTVPLLATFEAYAIEQRIKPGTAAEWRSMLKALVAFMGHDNAHALTVSDIDNWRDALLSNPGRGGRLRSPGTVKDKYLCAIRATLAWAVEKRLLPENVASSVKVRVPKKMKLRERDFTQDEAIKILSATFQSSTGINEYDRRARRWIPWLCAYTGARVNEIGQLRGRDIKRVDGIWIIEISPDAGTVKNNQSRHVPIHLHIVEQGFIRAINPNDDAPLFYDQSRIKNAGPTNRYYKKVGERLRDWIREEVGISDPAVQPNHGWRHTFKTRAIDAGVPERIADAIQGHSPRSVGQTYGSVSLEAKCRAINAMLRFSVPGQA